MTRCSFRQVSRWFSTFLNKKPIAYWLARDDPICLHLGDKLLKYRLKAGIFTKFTIGSEKHIKYICIGGCLKTLTENRFVSTISYNTLYSAIKHGNHHLLDFLKKNFSILAGGYVKYCIITDNMQFLAGHLHRNYFAEYRYAIKCGKQAYAESIKHHLAPTDFELLNPFKWPCDHGIFNFLYSFNKACQYKKYDYALNILASTSLKKYKPNIKILHKTGNPKFVKIVLSYFSSFCLFEEISRLASRKRFSLIKFLIFLFC